jgi:hypothetical protein
MNNIYLRRKQKILVIPQENNLSNVYLATILKNVENLGYTFSKEIIDIIKTFSEKNAIEFYKEILSTLKNILGANVQYTPMYPNFPKQVMETDYIELYINAIIHYITDGTWTPTYEKKERFPLIDEDIELKIIELGTKEEFDNIFKNLLNSKTSISFEDKEDLEWYIKNCDDIKTILPKEIPLKENVALFSRLLIDYIDNPHKYLSKYYKTATDVLRFAVELSEDGDISLKNNTVFKNFSRKERRMLLGLLELCGNIEEDMLRYKIQWIRLGEILHPGEYKNRFKKSYTAFEKLRNNKHIATFNSKLDKFIKEKNFSKAIELLSTRAGEFARNLDYILRIANDKYEVLNAFKNIVSKISTTVLLQVMTHFKYRNQEKELRVFFPKGNVAKVFGIKNTLEKLDESLCEYIIKFCENALIMKYSEKDILGKIYIDEELKNYLVPFSQRSASKALKTITRGSKIDIPEDYNTLRTFIYWKNGIQRTDIDLSTVFYDKDWNYKEHISYTNLQSRNYNVYHSGDFVDAPNGISEFIDIDLNTIKNNNVRYVIVSVNSFTSQPYCDLPICYMGWMNRKSPQSGEIYEPKTVKQKIDITTDTQICIPMIIDVVDNKIIWTDLALTKFQGWNSVENNQKGMILMAKGMYNLEKPNLYDLFMIHAKARGEIVKNKEEADVVYSIDGNITPFDTDVIMGEYL